MASQNEILISPSASGWAATYSGPHAAKIKSLFGTDTIPTAFTAGASADFVCIELAKLNPGVLIGVA